MKLLDYHDHCFVLTDGMGNFGSYRISADLQKSVWEWIASGPSPVTHATTLAASALISASFKGGYATGRLYHAVQQMPKWVPIDILRTVIMMAKVDNERAADYAESCRE